MKRRYYIPPALLLIVVVIYLGYVEADKNYMVGKLDDCEKLIGEIEGYKAEEGNYPDIGFEKEIVNSSRCQYMPDKALESFLLVVRGGPLTKHAYFYQSIGWVYAK